MDFGDIGGGLLSFIGQSQANQKNWDIAQSNNQFNREQFEQRYQTTVKDLQAAGLNPMLAYSQGPGTAPTASPVAPMQNALGNAVEGYNKTKQVSSAAQLQAEQVKVAESQVQLNSASAAKVLADAEFVKEQTKKSIAEEPLVRQQTKTSEDQAKMYQGQASASAAQAAQAYEQVKLITQNIGNLKAELQRIQQNNDQTAPESEIAKKYPTFYYIFHKLMPSLSGSIGKPYQFGR